LNVETYLPTAFKEPQYYYVYDTPVFFDSVSQKWSEPSYKSTFVSLGQQFCKDCDGFYIGTGLPDDFKQGVGSGAFGFPACSASCPLTS
jgi:hypothetical protein